MKAKEPAQAKKFEDIPNVGPRTAEDFKALGLVHPKDLVGQSAYELFERLCEHTAQRHDPCVIDVFLSAIHFMEGKGTKLWWFFTEERKKSFKVG